MFYRLLCLLTAIIWGLGFVAQVKGMDSIGPFAFSGIRFIIGSAILWPFIYFMKPKESYGNISLWCAILAIGLSLFCGATFQQVGLQYTTASNAAFLTSTYILMVPLLSAFLGFALRLNHILGLLLALPGVYAMSIGENLSINLGDLFMIFSAMGFSMQIIFLNYFTKRFSPILLSSGQFLVCGLLNLCLSVVLETTTLSGIENAAFSLLYAGLLSTGIAYTLQSIGQKHVPATEASMIFSMEMVFGAIAGFLCLDETLTMTQYIGAALMTLGVLLSQLPGAIIYIRKKEKRY